MSINNWANESKSETKTKAEKVLTEVKKKRNGNFKLVKVNDKLWKEVPI